MTILKQQKRTRRTERKMVREGENRTNEVQRPNEFGKEKKKSSVSKVIFKLSEMKQRHGSCF